MSARTVTKAAVLGVKPNRLRRYSVSRIVRAQALIAEIATLGDEIDSAVAFDADLAVQDLDRLSGSVEEGLSLLKAPHDDGMPS